MKTISIDNGKLDAFARLEESRKAATESIDYDAEREKAMNEKFGNEKIEKAIAALQQDPSEELLAHTLTVVRRRMREHGQVILAVDMPQEQNGQTGMPFAQNGFASAPAGTPTAPMQIQAVKTADGKAWWVAFTSFDEELRGGDQVKSTFLADLEQIFRTVLTVQEIEGVILNPWNRTMMLDKSLIRIVLGES